MVSEPRRKKMFEMFADLDNVCLEQHLYGNIGFR